MRAVPIGRKKRKYQSIPLIDRVIDGRRYNVSKSMKNVGNVTAVKTYGFFVHTVLYFYVSIFTFFFFRYLRCGVRLCSRMVHILRNGTIKHVRKHFDTCYKEHNLFKIAQFRHKIKEALKRNPLRPCETQISIFFKPTFKRLFGKRRTSSAPYT